MRRASLMLATLLAACGGGGSAPTTNVAVIFSGPDQPFDSASQLGARLVASGVRVLGMECGYADTYFGVGGWRNLYWQFTIQEADVERALLAMPQLRLVRIEDVRQRDGTFGC